MKLRTFTALLLAAIMLFALTACGSQAADDSSNDQQQEQHQQDRSAEERKAAPQWFAALPLPFCGFPSCSLWCMIHEINRLSCSF